MAFAVLFEKYAEWRVLKYLLESSRRSYVNEVAKKADVSKGTASKALKYFEEVGVLKVEKLGNVKMYSSIDSPLTRSLKKLIAISLIDEIGLVDQFLEKDSTLSSLALYGSFAEGTYDRKSDIDLLIVSENKNDFSELLDSLEKQSGREVTLLTYKISDLIKSRKSDPVFYENLKNNHEILYGAKLP